MRKLYKLACCYIYSSVRIFDQSNYMPDMTRAENTGNQD